MANLRVYLLLLLSWIVSHTSFISARSLNGLYDLINRRIPGHTNSFHFDYLPNNTSSGDLFIISDFASPGGCGNGGIYIQCTTTSACARGLYAYVQVMSAMLISDSKHRYLTTYGGVDIFWTGSRLDNLPSQLPPVGRPVNVKSIVPYRYHFNTVTFSYTTAFYDFQQWSLLLDWMALRGVNFPLAWVGNEYILREVFLEAELSDADIASFFSGPAYQAWNRFGNIQGSWGGDLPVQWIDDQFTLQKQILHRMTDLGMTPILPAFTGFVPRAMAHLNPNASIVNGSQWNKFPTQFTNVSFLEPFDSLFARLQMSFLQKQAAAYGNISHIYALDQYNENDPFSGNTSYLSRISQGVFTSLRAADPDAVWLMQGWLFFSSEAFWTIERVKAYLDGVQDVEGLLVLDLYSEARPQWERLDSYFGKSWIWCTLHGFGGNMGFEGNLATVTQEPLRALHSPQSSMVGIGLTMEGQEGNELLYDIALDQAWSMNAINISNYVAAWVKRRYHVQSSLPLPQVALDAWRILQNSVYNNNDPDSQATVKSILELSPALSGLANRTGNHPTKLFYDTNSTILPALRGLLQAKDENPSLSSVSEFKYDVVDLTRQLLANRFLTAYVDLVAIYNASNSSSSEVRQAGQPLLAILLDLDDLLMTDDNFLLSNWIRDARSWAHGNTSYEAYLEYNARTQITLWGPNGEINDYASKQWGGLVREYYLPRWTAFLNYLEQKKKAGSPYDWAEVNKIMLDIGMRWVLGRWGENEGESWGTIGDTWSTVNRVLETWA
jgi:alpha-N-acetylglucosaminidase